MTEVQTIPTEEHTTAEEEQTTTIEEEQTTASANKKFCKYVKTKTSIKMEKKEGHINQD